MKNNHQVYALITGAGRGLGRAFAIELASRGSNVLLTALPGESLDTFCQELRSEYHVQARYFECDLTSEQEINELVCWIRENFSVNLLINNAGIGGTSEFEKAKGDLINNIILLNVRATALITHQLLPLLKLHHQAWILNVASMASFSPIGYKTVYPASKVFVLNFSRGLYEELKGSGVFVSVVHPGPMKTNEDCSKRIERQGMLAKTGILSPETMAKKTLDKLFKKDSLILIGWMNKLNWLMMKTVPTWIRLPLITQIVKREIQKSPDKKNCHENFSYGSQQLAGNKYHHRVA